MGIPLTVQAIGFNTLFAAAVPQEWRASVAGTRNMFYSVTYMLSALGAGWLLVHLAFPIGYQVVFGMGGFAALMSSAHLFFVRIKAFCANHARLAPSLEQDDPKKAVRPQPLVEQPAPGYLADTLAGVLLPCWDFHLTQYLAIPLFSALLRQCFASDRSKHRDWYRPLLFDQHARFDPAKLCGTPAWPPQSHRPWVHDHELIPRADGLCAFTVWVLLRFGYRRIFVGFDGQCLHELHPGEHS